MLAIDEALILILAPVITAIVSAIKMMGLPSRFAPITSMVTGGALTAVFAEPGAPIRSLVLTGICAGLTSSGLYAGTKAMGEKTTPVPTVHLEQMQVIGVSDFETENVDDPGETVTP